MKTKILMMILALGFSIPAINAQRSQTKGTQVILVVDAKTKTIQDIDYFKHEKKLRKYYPESTLYLGMLYPPSLSKNMSSAGKRDISGINNTDKKTVRTKVLMNIEKQNFIPKSQFNSYKIKPSINAQLVFNTKSKFLPGDHFLPGDYFLPGDHFLPGDRYILGSNTKAVTNKKDGLLIIIVK